MKYRSHVFRRRAHHQSAVVTKLASGFRRFQKRWYKDDEELFRALRGC